tara:strand:+ start:78 stop:1334 length:1257 start_codon:yes stop_codon:yes gene_type:complete
MKLTPRQFFSVTAVVTSALLICTADSNAVLKARSQLFQVGPNPSAIVAVDINGDEWPEIITADRGTLSDLREERPANDELSLLVAVGDLKYEKHHPSLKTDFGPYAIAVANIDAHRWPDILVASFHASRHRDISLFLNLQDEGVFKPNYFPVPSEQLNYFRQLDGDGMPIFHKPGLTSIRVGDINKDGLRDVVAVGWGSDVLVCMDGDSEIIFKPPRISTITGGPFSLVLGDFNLDKILDVAVTLMATNEVAILRGDGAGEFTETQRFSSRGRLPHKIESADINQDGQADLVVSHRYTDDSIVIFYGAGDFSFPVSQEILLGPDREVLEHEVRDITLGDFNQDGFPDIAAACFSSKQIITLSTDNSKNKSFLEFKRNTYSFEGGQPRALCAADLNNDGKDDIAVALWGLNMVGILLNQ